MKRRPTVRIWLVGVAIVALAMGLEDCHRRRAYCLERSRVHRTGLYHDRKLTEPMDREEEDRLARKDAHLAWHIGVARKFERAAHRPWEAVPIEPSELEERWPGIVRSIYFDPDLP